MNGQAADKGIRRAFFEEVEKQGLSVVTMGALAAGSDSDAVRKVFLRLGQADREVYLIRGVGIINLHVRSSAPGWWNILRSVKKDLDWLRKDLKYAAYYVLLVSTGDQAIAKGYIFSEFAYPPFKKKPTEETTKYSINEGPNLDRSKAIPSIAKVASVLAGYRKPNNAQSAGKTTAL